MSALGIFEACAAQVTLPKQKPTVLESTLTCICCSASELWIRGEFHNEERIQFLHSLYYKRITVKWRLSDHLGQELKRSEISEHLSTSAGHSREDVGRHRSGHWLYSGVQARQRGNADLMLKMSLLSILDSLGARSSVATHWYNTVLIFIEMYWSNMKC